MSATGKESEIKTVVFGRRFVVVTALALATTALAPVTALASQPDPPTGVSATAGNASATVSWTAPVITGGTAIASYTVTSIPDGVTATTSGLSTTVSPLTNGTSYTFTVTATNSDTPTPSTSLPSSPSNPVIPVAPSTVPGAPNIGSATAGNASASVSWTAPGSDGGSPITAYTVTSSPGGITASAGGSATSATVSPLNNGTSYTFTVTATNAIGTGPASGPSNPVIPVAPSTVPGAPNIGSATAGNASASVSWTAPGSDGGSPITGYTVTSTPGGITASAGGSATNATVSPLNNGTSYTFTVTATNAIGTGPASSPSPPVIPNAGVPTVTLISPNGGPPTGGTVVTITGSNFDPTSKVNFGGTAGTSVIYTSSSRLTATSPAGTVGAVVDITVTTAGGISGAVAADKFTYATAPAAPTTVTALAGHLSAVVSWTAAVSNGSTISAYTVTPSPAATPATVTGTTTSVTVTGLSGGVSYTFTVTATNGFGPGPASLPSNAVTVAGAGVSCITATLSPNPTSPALAGTTISVVATSTGCPTPMYEFFLVYPNGTVVLISRWSTTVTSFSWATIAGQSPIGTYQWRIGANNFGDSTATFEARASLNFTLVSGCTGATIGASPLSPQQAGTQITFTATSLVCAIPEYQFWWQYPGGSWNVGRPFSTSNTWTWLTAGFRPASYKIVLWVNQSGTSLATSQSFAQMTMTLNGCFPVSISTSPAPPQHPGTAIQLTAQASACTNPKYQFWILAPGSSSWQLLQPYSIGTPTFTWSATGPVLGTYNLMVWARDLNSGGFASNSLGSWDSYASSKYTLISSNACTAVPFTTSPSGTALAGTLVTITATASGCSSPLYQFWILAPGSSTWVDVQRYSSARTYTWSAVVRPAGTYNFAVWVRDSTSPGIFSSSFGRWDALASGPYSLTSQPCTSVNAGTSPGTSAPVGTPVTISAVSPVGCPHPLYEFWILAPGSSTWQAVQLYASSASFSWSTTGKAKGAYHFSVWARDTSSTGTSGNSLGRWDAYSPTIYTLT